MTSSTPIQTNSSNFIAVNMTVNATSAAKANATIATIANVTSNATVNATSNIMVNATKAIETNQTYEKNNTSIAGGPPD